MKFCDKHKETPAAYTIEFAFGETFDLCNECSSNVKGYMAGDKDIFDPKKKPPLDKPPKKVVKRKGRKKKTDAN